MLLIESSRTVPDMLVRLQQLLSFYFEQVHDRVGNQNRLSNTAWVRARAQQCSKIVGVINRTGVRQKINVSVRLVGEVVMIVNQIYSSKHLVKE